MKSVLRFAACLALLAAAALAQEPDAGVLMQAERDFAAAAAARGVDGWMEFMAPNAVELAPEPLVGLDQIRAGLTKRYRLPGFKLTWEPTRADFVGKAKDLGYAVGRYQLTLSDDKGTPQVEHGSYMTTWQKQKDGSWKVVADIGTPDLPVK